MSLEAIYFISQIVSALAIVASLIFVALQMRQADRTQRAMMQQLRAQRGMDMTFRTMNEDIAKAMGRVFEGDQSVTATDVRQVSSFLRGAILNFNDTVWQHKAGYLDQATYDYTVATLRTTFSNPGVRAAWIASSRSYSDAQVKLVNDVLIDGQELLLPPDWLGTWRTIANQLSAQAQPAPTPGRQN
jgi:hypothetical protein